MHGRSTGSEGNTGKLREFCTIGDLYSADAALAVQKAEEVRNSMMQYGYGDTPLYVSALGVTRYQAAAAQIGGHCAAHLIKCNLELNDLVQGIGCWKALNCESEYLEENQIVGNGWAPISHFDLKNINWYAQVFLTGLMPYRLFSGPELYRHHGPPRRALHSASTTADELLSISAEALP